MQIPFTKHALGNGLEVIVHEDRRLPMVAVNVWYHVGSKNERPGRTGLAHLFEHLMFEGSAHHDRGYFEPLQRAGALVNGSTNADRTNYWEVVPTGAIELALWLESDRMGHLLPALTAEKFANQRDVVLNERRQNYENRPYGMAGIALAAALFEPGHPYSWPTIGAAVDLRAATLDEVRAFFGAYYHPGNASLALAGDIAPDEGIRLAERYFGELPAGPAVGRVAAEARLPADRNLAIEDRVERPRLHVAWHSPAMFDEGDAELDVAAELLACGKTSRLYRSLVHERRVATDVSAHQHSRELSGTFQVTCTAATGVPLGVLDEAIVAEVAALARGGPTDAELARAGALTEAQFVYRLQTIGGFGGKSDQLNAYNVFRGDPAFFEADLGRYRAVDAAGVARAAARWLSRPRVTLSVVPRGHPEAALSGAVEVGVS